MADKILFANVVKSTLAAGISDVATSLTVQAGHGTKFPSPIAGEYFIVRLKDASNNYEIVHCTSRAVDVLTIVRGREGTVGRAFAAGDKLEIVVTKETLETFPQRGVAETIDGNKTFSGQNTHSNLNIFSGKTQFSNGIGPDYKNNYGLAISVAAKALTAALVGADGTNPSATNPVGITFRSATAAVGTPVTRAVTGALSLVSPSGATHGFTASQTSYLYYYALDNAGTVELAVSGSNQWDESTLQSTTAIDANSDSASVLYSTTARAGVPIRYLGRVKIQTGAVPGEWDNEDTEVSVQALGFFNVELTGKPTAPTPSPASNSTEVATTAFVQGRLGEPSKNLTIFKCGGVNIPQNATRYLKAVGTTPTATEADAQVPIGLPTEIYAMKIYLSEAVPSGQTVTVTVRKDAADTSLTQVIAGPTSAGAVVSVTGSVLYGKKYNGTPNQLSVKVVCSATTGSTNDIAVALLARVPGSTNKPVSPFALGSTTPGVNNFTYGGEFKTPGRIRASLDSITLSSGALPVPQTVIERFEQTENTAWLYVDATVANQVTGNYNLPLPLESAVSFAEDNANTAFTGYFVLSDRQCGNETGTWSPLLFSSSEQAQGTTRYMGGYGMSSASATEADVKIPVPAGKAWKLRARSSTLLSAGQTAVITVLKNGVDTALTVTLTDTIQTKSEESISFTTADNDLISIRCVTSAATGTVSYNVVLELDRES